MKRSFLTDLGITNSEVIKHIIDFHQNVVQDLKDELSKANDDLKDAQGDLKIAKKTISDLQNSVVNDDKEGYKQKYDEEVQAHAETKVKLKEEFNAYKASVESEKITASKQSVLRKQLEASGANVKLISLLEKEFDISKIELDGDKIKEWDSVLKPVKERYTDLFGTTTMQGTPPASPPANEISSNPFAKETFNLQQQTELFRKDPVTARQMAALAGMNLPQL